MEVKVLQYVDDAYKEFRLGWAITELIFPDTRQTVTLSVCRNKQGDPFCKFPCVKIKEKWTPTNEFSRLETEEIMKKADSQARRMVAMQQNASAHELIPSDDVVPF